MASPFLDAPGTVYLPESGGGCPDRLLSKLRLGELTRPFILDTGGMRHLYFDLNAVQSSMRLDDPNLLVTAYTQKMMAFLLFNRSPRHVVMIGLGGGSLVKFCYRHLRDTRLTVVEIDPGIIALRDWFHIPADDGRLRIVLGDGAELVGRKCLDADVLLIDAFDQSGVAPSLASDEFYTQAFQRLGPDGMLVMNLAGDCDRYIAHLERLRGICPGSTVLVPVEGDGNVLIFASGRSVSTTIAQCDERLAQELKIELALEFPIFLRRLRAGQVL